MYRCVFGLVLVCMGVVVCVIVWVSVVLLLVFFVLLFMWLVMYMVIVWMLLFGKWVRFLWIICDIELVVMLCSVVLFWCR